MRDTILAETCAECGNRRDATVHWNAEGAPHDHDFVPLGKCWGEMVLTDSCYGMTGGRKYVCQKCGSYVVTRSPDSHPHRCTAAVLTPPSDAGTSERETAYPFTPELVAKLAAECDRVAEQWAPVAECIAEAKAALANCNPPHSPESDPSGLYYPLLFLVKRLEEYDNAE